MALELVSSECGIYGQDTLIARGLPNDVVDLELICNDQTRRHWIVDSNTTLERRTS